MRTIQTKNFTKQADMKNQRYRVEIFVDYWVPFTGNEESDKSVVKEKAEELSLKIPNSYVGDVFDPMRF